MNRFDRNCVCFVVFCMHKSTKLAEDIFFCESQPKIIMDRIKDRMRYVDSTLLSLEQVYTILSHVSYIPIHTIHATKIAILVLLCIVCYWGVYSIHLLLIEIRYFVYTG